MILTKHYSAQQQERRGKDLVGRPQSNCSRCGEFLVRSLCISPDQGTREFEIPVWKCCLPCGDVLDATILKTRHYSHHRTHN